MTDSESALSCTCRADLIHMLIREQLQQVTHYQFHKRIDHLGLLITPRTASNLSLCAVWPAGVLVAVDSQGSSHVLKAFSGQITETWHIPGVAYLLHKAIRGSSAAPASTASRH